MSGKYIFLSLVLVALSAVSHAADRPNIILMMADDFGYECLSCNGGGPYRTPVLDGLAKTGIRFTNCHSQPLCTPSRVEIMTGRYNFRNYKNFGKLEESEKTFGHVLRDAGYATCIVGKWQLGRDRKLIDHFGFDEYCLWWLEQRGGRYMNPSMLVQNGKNLEDLEGKYGPDVVSDFLLDFVTRHKDKPFLCYYPMILTHSPYVSTPDSKTSTEPEGKKTKGRKGKKGADESNVPRTNQNFVDMVEHTDKIVGKIVAHLEELGIRDNTVILFTGDNGTGRGVISMLDGKPWPGGKGGTGENGTHVPFVANWPAGKASGVVLDDLVDFTDFMPTLAELAGAKLPGGVTIDGRSFAPQLRGKKGNPRDWIYFWYSGKGGSGREWARDHRFKLYKTGQFFDVTADPLQKLPLTNLDDEAKAAREKLQAVLDQMQKTQKK